MARKKTNSNIASQLFKSAVIPFILAIVFFFAVCSNTESEIKVTALVAILLAIGAMAVRFPVLRERIGMPLAALGAFVLICFVSTLYAVSGKFALQEFLKIISSFCLVLILVCLAPKHGASPARWVATILEGAIAVAALVSIDLLSTHIISSAVLSIIELFTDDFALLNIVEPGVRMTSMFDLPNVFAGCAGIGVLLSLGLVQESASGKERMAHICCLFINSFAFVLAFSMGATAAVIAAFVVYIVFEKSQRRGALIVTMIETLVLAVVGAAIVSTTSFQYWNGFDIIPLGYTVIGCVALCLANRFINPAVSEKLNSHRRLIPTLICIIAAVIVAFALLACFVTGGVDMGAGEVLRRAAYPDAGEYTLESDFDGTVAVVIESQNQQETMMHTSTTLYWGYLEGATFTVPEDSKVVYFNFYPQEDARINEVNYVSSASSGSVPLDYKLLPGFIANRLQGLFANENAIQRTVFFSDGIKIWLRSPVFGTGLGAYENGIKGVQSFFYETRYAHNHYIQLLAETGVVGLLIFVGLIVVSAAALLIARKKENAGELLPALAAALVFMAFHAFTEVTFSVYCYIPFAFGVFALINLSCADAFKWPRTDKKHGNKDRIGVTIGFAAMMLAFGVMLVCNISAAKSVSSSPTFDTLEQAASIDKYEWADYALSYVVGVGNKENASLQMQNKADKFAERLSRVNSNVIPVYLAQYYFNSGREQMAVDMLKKYVGYVSSDVSVWEAAFGLLEQYNSGSDTISSGVAEIAGMLEQWNAENIGDIVLSDSAQAFIATISQ